MLREMSELSDVIYKTAIMRLNDKKWFLEKTNEAFERFNMPIDQASDYLNGNKKVAETDWFTGFVLASVISVSDDFVKHYFTPIEIAQYKDQKFPDRLISKIDLPMVQVANDQWIGAASFKWLMEIEDSHLLCYNENTQRVPRARTKPGGGIIYEPYVNQRSVKEIAEAFRRGDYVPNTITFNIREGIDCQYEDGRIIIERFAKGQPIFDIIDGYHRYRAMRQVYITNPKFDYGMELRIVRFSVEKARQFIYQESLRNKMRKVDQAAFNQNSVENQIVDELNETLPFRNMFSGVEAKIDKAVMAAAIRNVYFPRAEMRARARKIEVRKELIAKGRVVEEYRPEIFEVVWPNTLIVSMVLAPYDEDAPDHYIDNISSLVDYMRRHDLMTRKGTLESDIRRVKKEFGFRKVEREDENV